MPYRLNPVRKNCVQKQENGKWEDIKCHNTVAQAQKHLAALEINVEKKEE